MVLHEYALELAWREAEDNWRVSDRVRDEQKEGAREGRGKETKEGRRRGHTMTSPPSYATTSRSSVASPQHWGQCEVVRVEVGGVHRALGC